jgi:magnesium chelatase accessory protein
MSARLQWDRDGLDWPNRTASRFVEAAGINFHIQIMGDGPPIVLIHGTGSSTHTWRDIMPKLASRFTVVAFDLPGHAFTRHASPSQLSLPGMAKAIANLLALLRVAPERMVGHSAGAAIAVQMVHSGYVQPVSVLSFNGAFFPFAGLVGQFFSPLAKTIASFGFIPKLIANMADRPAIERLLNDTGSHLDPAGLGFYQRLFGDDAHVAGTLRMMASWDLAEMSLILRRFPSMIYLVKATKDRTVPPETANEVAAITPRSAVISMKGLGHLAHEEDPFLAANIMSNPETFGSISGSRPSSLL